MHSPATFEQRRAAPRLQTALEASKQGLRVCTTSGGHQKKEHSIIRLNLSVSQSLSFVSVDNARETSPGNRGLTLLLPPRCGTHTHTHTQGKYCKGFANLQCREEEREDISSWESRPRNCELLLIGECGELRVLPCFRGGKDHTFGRDCCRICSHSLSTSQEGDKRVKESQIGCGSPRIPVFGPGCMSATYYMLTSHAYYYEFWT